MRWVASLEKDAATGTLEKRHWAAAGQFRANSCLEGDIRHGGKINSTIIPPP
jgi:hypothetical protein